MRMDFRSCLACGFFIGFAFASAPAFALATGSNSFDATSEIVGRKPGGQFETPVNQHLHPAGTLVELPGMRPQAIAISPDGRLVATSGKAHTLVVMAAATGAILQYVPLPEDTYNSHQAAVSEQITDPDQTAQLSFTGLIFSPDGTRLYLSSVTGDIKVFAVEQGRVRGLFAFPLPAANAPAREEEIPAGLALSADGKRLYVALNLSNRLLEMDAATGKTLRLSDVGVEPYDVLLSGRKVYVSNWGGRRPETGSLTGPAGRGTFVRVDPVHFVAEEGSVSIIDLDGREKTREILTGLHACALALSPDGRMVVVANAGSDTVSVIDTSSSQIIETIDLHQHAGDPFGAQPDALAFDKSGKTLFVCNGTQNAVAVVHFKPGQSKLLGLIPVGWFPGAIAYNAAHKSLCVANIKGLPPGETNGNSGNRKYNSKEWHGSVSFVPVPSEKKLREMTRTALDGVRYPLLAQAALPARSGQSARPVPERTGEPSLIKHVIYIIKENRTYDQVLGDMKEGMGDPSLCIFGERITPNNHKLSRQFVLLDNTCCCGSQSSDGHQWTDTAIATDYMERAFAGFPRSYPAGGSAEEQDAMAYSPTGFIWDDASAHGKTILDFGEFTSSSRNWQDSTRKGHPNYLDIYHDVINGTHETVLWSEPTIDSIRPFIVSNTVGFDLHVPDAFRAQQFTNSLQQFERAGKMPDLILLWLSNDHTSGVKSGFPTPASYLADNDLALGKIVDALSHSSFWKDSCLFAIEDDPQAGWDHLTGYRTTAYMAGPYVRHQQVIHTQYNQTSLLRTIELILGLPPMNQMDATATPMFDCFSDQPDFTAYTAVSNNVPLDQMNPAPRRLSDRILRQDARMSARMNFEQEDKCPEDVLNRILWRAMKGTTAAYPAWAVQAADDD